MSQLKITSQIIELEFARFYLAQNNLVVSEYKRDVIVDLETAKKINRIIGELCDYKRSNQLFIACTGLDANRDARKWGLTEEANQYTLKSAIVCDSLAHRILGNVLINIKGFPRPTKMFADVYDAIKWLEK
ncbi:MAG: hypothetical protein ACO2Z9_07860 [Crocinitomicaceae bacterium]